MGGGGHPVDSCTTRNKSSSKILKTAMVSNLLNWSFMIQGINALSSTKLFAYNNMLTLMNKVPIKYLHFSFNSLYTPVLFFSHPVALVIMKNLIITNTKLHSSEVDFNTNNTWWMNHLTRILQHCTVTTAYNTIQLVCPKKGYHSNSN